MVAVRYLCPSQAVLAVRHGTQADWHFGFRLTR